MKKFWKNNKIAILFAGVIILMIVIFSLMVFPLYSSRSGSKYGNRLDGIKEVEIKNKTKKEIEEIFKNNDNVKKITISLKGKIYNIVVTLNDGVNPSDFTDTCNEALGKFDEDQIKYYDIQFFVTSKLEETKSIIGYKNKNSEYISWTNNK